MTTTIHNAPPLPFTISFSYSEVNELLTALERAIEVHEQFITDQTAFATKFPKYGPAPVERTRERVKACRALRDRVLNATF